MLSPAFRVREFQVVDWNAFPLKVTYKSEDGKCEGALSIDQGLPPPPRVVVVSTRPLPSLLSAAYARCPRSLCRHGQSMPAHLLAASTSVSLRQVVCACCRQESRVGGPDVQAGAQGLGVRQMRGAMIRGRRNEQAVVLCLDGSV
eukprot:3130211-Rhodomonas_salina.1